MGTSGVASEASVLARASLLLLVVGCLVRVAFPDSDPYYYRWLGFINDEGRWVEHARRAALGGPWLVSDAHNEHLLLSPAFSAVSYAAFKVAGVSAAAARFFPALCGCLLLLLLGFFLRRRVPQEGLFLALAILALQGDFVMLSRVAIPEMPLALGALAVFCVLHGADRPRPFLAGALCAATLTLKGTAFPLVPLFAFLAFAYPAGPLSRGGRERWRHAGVFGAGVASVGLPGLLAILVLAPERIGGLGADLRHLIGFLQLPGLQTLATIPLYSSLSPVLNLTALAIWTLLLRDQQNNASSPIAGDDAALRRLRRAAWAWLLLYPAQMLSMQYLPPRYQAHLLIPTAILLAASWTRLVSFRAADVARAIGETRGPRRFATRMGLVLPSVVWCIPVLCLLAVLLDVPLDRVRFRAPLFGAALAAAAWLARTAWRVDARGIRVLVTFPWVCTILWFALFLLLPGRVPFWPTGLPGALALLALVAVGALLAQPRAQPAWTERSRHVPVALAGGLSVLWAIHLAPAFLAPQHTLVDISRALGDELRHADIVMTSSEGLFLDNAIRHRDPLDDPIDDRTLATYHVIAGDLAEPAEMERRYRFSKRYELVKRYPLQPPPPFARTCNRTFGCTRDFGVSVFRRRDETNPVRPSAAIP